MSPEIKKVIKRMQKTTFSLVNQVPWWAIWCLTNCGQHFCRTIYRDVWIWVSPSVWQSLRTNGWQLRPCLIVGKFFLPIFIEKKLYTIPEFIEQRYSTNLKTILAVFWIALFVFVNLTSVLYLGSKALDTIIGVGDGSLMMTSIIGLALFAAAYSLWGGLSAVAWTDVCSGDPVSFWWFDHDIYCAGSCRARGWRHQWFKGIFMMWYPRKFSMILSKGEIITPNGTDAWWDLPGLAVLIGGMWVANLYYWGFNQYIIQRTLAAKSLAAVTKRNCVCCGTQINHSSDRGDPGYRGLCTQ